MDSGWVKIHRQLSSTDLWLSEPFTRGQAWVDLIILTNHKDGFYRVRGIKINVKRGQCGWSEVALSKRWQWSRGKVRRFLCELETVHQIVQQKTNVTTLINIVNYDRYQIGGTADSTANGQQVVQQTDSKRYTNKNEKKEKKVKNTTPIVPLPEWLDKNLWAEFLKMRTSLKKPVSSQLAITRLLNSLEKLIKEGHSQDEIIGLAVERSWQSFYAPVDNKPFGKIGGDLHSKNVAVMQEVKNGLRKRL